MKNLALVMGLLLASHAWSDEIVMKDGKKIEWAAIRDQGEAYEIETPQGTKMTLKKVDIEKIVVSNVSPAPLLTGAAMSFDKKKKLDVVDLLAAVDMKKDVQSGTWKSTPKGLTVTCGEHAKLQTNYAVPDEYDLDLTLSRTSGSDDFFVGLVAGGKQLTFHMDAYKGAWSGPQMIDGKPSGADSEIGVVGKRVFTNGTARQVTFMVRKEALAVRLDGKEFYFTWRASWDRVSLHPIFIMPNKSALFLGCFASSWSITQIKVSVPKN